MLYGSIEYEEPALNRIMLPLLAALVIGGLAGAWFVTCWQAAPNTPTVATGKTPDPGLPTDNVLEAALNGLRADLQREIEDRKALEMRVAELNAAIAVQKAGTLIAAPRDAETPGSDETPLVGLDALLYAGIDTGTATWLQEQIDAMEMDELWLTDRATREGWRGSGRYLKEKRAIRARLASLRDELNNDDTWDRLLYATNRKNRVILQHIMHNSPAEQYGLQEGDNIISYNGQRIFTSGELLTATTEGQTGTTVLVEVERDGQRLNLSLPSGPIGGRILPARVRP